MKALEYVVQICLDQFILRFYAFGNCHLSAFLALWSTGKEKATVEK